MAPYFVDMGSRFVFVYLSLLTSNVMSWSQSAEDGVLPFHTCDSTWIVSGVVSDIHGRWIPSSMVVNRRTKAGEFVGSDGEFLVRACEGDTLVFGAVGYHTQEKSVSSSDAMNVVLNVLNVEVGTAEVIAPRTLEEIVKDIQGLGYREEDFRVSGINAIQSPITWLYEAFAREPKSQREVARLENDDRRRALLQELFTKYVDYEIVDLESWEFDAFARFCDPGEEALQRWSQYDFILYIKQRYQVFRLMPRAMPAEEMEYHLDAQDMDARPRQEQD